MKVYDAGESFALKVNIEEVGIPQEGTYRIVDHAGVVVVPESGLEVFGDDTHAEIDISHTITTLAEGERRKMLTVELVVFGQDQERFKFSESVLIQKSSQLEVPTDSFMTVNEAVLVSMDIFGMDDWSAADSDDRRRALIEATHRLKQLRYKLFTEEPFDHVEFEAIADIIPYGFEGMTKEQFDDLPPRFLRDVKLALVVEANEVLGGESAQEKRKSGVLSDTVGETSQMFRTGRPMDTIISNRAMSHVKRWVDTAWRVRRG